jgi:glutathione peroxidase
MKAPFSSSRFFLAIITAMTFAVGTPSDAKDKEKKVTQSVYDFTVKNIDGQETPLSQYKGKALLIVNVASRCGFTPQYEGLEALYKKYGEKGLVVLGFPSNDFMAQEPGTDAEIKTFCATKYNVTFPLFSKIPVKGAEIHPLYQYLTDPATDPEFPGEISWNFNKFVVDRSGKIIARFGSRETPESLQIARAVEIALKN